MTLPINDLSFLLQIELFCRSEPNQKKTKQIQRPWIRKIGFKYIWRTCRGWCPIFITFFLLVSWTLWSLTTMTRSYKAPGQSITETGIGLVVWGHTRWRCRLLGSRHYFITIFATGIAFRISKMFQIVRLLNMSFKLKSLLLTYQDNFLTGNFAAVVLGVCKLSAAKRLYTQSSVRNREKKILPDPGQNFPIPMTTHNHGYFPG